MKKNIKDKNGVTIIMLVVMITLVIIIAAITLPFMDKNSQTLNKAEESKTNYEKKQLGEIFDVIILKSIQKSEVDPANQDNEKEYLNTLIIEKIELNPQIKSSIKNFNNLKNNKNQNFLDYINIMVGDKTVKLRTLVSKEIEEKYDSI